MKFISPILALMLAASPAAAGASDHAIRSEILVAAPARDAFALWTTNEGVQSFFPGAKNGGTDIRLAPGGPFEIYFLPDNPEGMRGCDGCVFLGFEEGRMLSFTWTNRPDHAVRPYRTHVTLRFEPLTPTVTRVSLEQDGWGESAEWKVARDYFADAWPRVLAAFRERAERGIEARK